MRKTVETETQTFVYKGVPKGVSNGDPREIIHSGETTAPFQSEIQEIEEKIQDVRGRVSKELDKWILVRSEARSNGDDTAFDRASNELEGLYAVIEKISRALS